ncbi:hypothetical protein B9W68_21355 [Streptomyces sp. CS227]|nr:hypothetical protein B9W68_21355 [Streptomyces sp. CS227]
MTPAPPPRTPPQPHPRTPPALSREHRRRATPTTCCLGIRLEPDDHWRVYAPHGLADVFNLVLRPNPVLAPREVYEAKAERWRGECPELRVQGWPEAD